jgi:hypothetical protein
MRLSKGVGVMNAMCTADMFPPPVLFSIGATARAAQGATNLLLLRDLEQTVDAIYAIRDMFEEFRNAFAGCERLVNGSPIVVGQFFDADDAAVSALESVTGAVDRVVSVFVAKRSCIDRDGALSPDLREHLHDAYEQLIEVLAQASACAAGARDAIIRHDLAVEPRDGIVYADIYELHATLVK